MSGARRPPWTVVLVASLAVAVRGALPQRPALLHFAHALYNVSIAENSVGRTYAVQPSGEDPLGLGVPLDGEPLEIRYKIIGGDKDKFFKAEDRLVGDFCFLSIRTRTGSTDVLNRERKDKYVLEVRATASKRDGKNKVILEVNTTVHVTIIDTNDLNPLFYPTEYSVTVPEDTPLHKSIIKVTAEDADLGINGEIYYSFADETEQFAIHPTTGVITITQTLVFTDRSFHELVVLGEDRGGALFRSSSTSHTSRAKVTVSVRQVNLFAPEIYVHHLPDIVENSSAEIYAIVRVLDKDEGIHGKIKSLEIVDGDPDGHFRIQPAKQLGEYNIIVHQLLDREKTPHGYNLTLRASDMGTPMKQSYKLVPVHLADLNDNAPVFNREIYEVSIPETAPVNTPVIRLKVTDKDQGKNAQVFLEIVGGNEGGEFYVNPDTGMLYTAVTLDAESKAFYTLTVSAIDQGNTGIRKQSSAKVKINILDTNDNDPLFDKPELVVWIDENEPTGTSVIKVTARDKDSGENAYISYSIANLNPVPFEIDHFSGVIKTTQVLDYESMKREFILRVRASDWGLPYRRQTEMQLTIKVKDINDNRPQFEKLDCIGYIPRYIPIGSEIITLSAIDFDAGNIISYRIISGNEDNCFNIDTTSGVLSISCDLKDIRADEREVNVTATDGTHFADVARIILRLINAKKTSSLVGRILTDDSGSFECRDTGVARRLTEVLAAAERNNMPGRDVNQEDFAMMPSRYGENVHTPEFLDFPLEIKVNESVPLGTTLTKLKARDRDLGYNGKLIFGISSGDQDSVFRIDPETGDLKIIGYLDRERESEYYLNITVYDLGKPQKSVSRVLPITVLDINDNAPKFEKSLASFRVTENALNGTSIFKVNATDIDSGEFAKITYSLVTDTNDFFVDTLTGILVVSAPLDRERQSLYELRIRAKDNGGLYSDALVRVSIDDINDNAPQFTLSTYNFKIREDVPRGTVVAIINAVDYDLGSGGEVKYSIVDEGDLDGSFKIDPLSGTLRTATLLDFEERQVHSLTVRATDQGLPSLYSETSVIIEIVDVNENLDAPVFSDFVLEGSVSENKPVGTKVFVVKATDADPPGGDSRITYSIIGGNGMGYFTIDNQGQIRTLAVLDVETTPHYWLTVCAQDQGVVPLHSCVQVYIRVENENDIVPLTEEAIYHASIPENSPGGRLVLRLRALDGDIDPAQRLSYKIVSGNPEGLFSINSSTGEIVTTGRRLDRESQEEHSIEVQVSDGGRPTLASTTRVIIALDDLNDNAPHFLEKFYSMKVPATVPGSKPVAFQNDDSGDLLADSEGSGDMSYDDTSPWETFEGIPRGRPLLRVLAHDEDAGANGDVTYSIKSGKGKSKFHIHPKTGVIVSTKDLDPGSFYELNVRATDGGSPARASTARVSVAAVDVPRRSPHAPRAQPASSVAVAELDQVGFLVAVLQATDEDGDTLWYDIVGGDTRNEFYIGQENGNILLAKKLVWEVQNNYTLNISISDGTHVIYTPLNVSVVNDINEKRPKFEKRLYVTEVSEGWFGSESNLGGTSAVGEPILSPRAEGDGRLLYGLHASRSPESAKLFKVDTLTGAITVKAPLDRETMEEHLLTISVRDQALRSRRDYTRVLIKVHDKDDHAPEFSSRLAQARVFANAPVGAAVARVRAFDRDKGKNAEIYYSITGGNVGGVFSIDSEMGDITLSKELDVSSTSEYMLQVKASNPGPHPLSASIPVHIMVTMADNSSPRFSAQEVTAEMYENEPPATFVKHLEVQSTSSVLFEIIDGNVEDAFGINPSTGVIVIKYGLDYETLHFYNLTVMATNMGGASATCSVVVHVLDKNDNAPTFLRTFYNGSLPESAPISSLVLMNSSTPLVIATEDLDSEINALRSYEIMDAVAAEYFNIDSTTGAVKTIKELDHETIPQFEFNVKVIDMGKPRLTSDTTAKVIITVLDVNDCPPKFEESVYNATLLLPTYKNVAILTVQAHDQDTLTNDTLKYDIIDGDKGNVFVIDSIQGVLTVIQPEKVKPHHRLHIRVSDGKYSSTAKINIKVEESENSGLVFQKSHYEGSIVENSTKIVTVAVLNVLGSGLNEHVRFRILNPTDMFTIGLTSGAIQTTGIRFDREVTSSYMLIVEARSIVTSLFNNDNTHRVAHVKVNVTVMDVNDNCPMFVNLPYYAVVSVDDQKGQVITKVHAIDDDINENGEVRYEMKRGHGELFKVCRRTGEISLKQNLEGHNKEYQLIIGAYDGGVTPCYSEATVYVKVVDRSMPVFDKQFYSVTVPENIEVQSPIGVPMQATSPLDRKLIYTIIQGNDLEEFSLDFNTAPDSSNGPCILYAAEELDYETQKQHDLVVRATDSVSGVHAEVSVTVSVTDVNDCPPVFPVDSYNVSVSEGAPFGSMILKVEAEDNDTDFNKEVKYVISDDSGNASMYFHIDPDDGSIYLKQSLDREIVSMHHFTLVATDKGFPPLSSTVHVWINVQDMNDNPPRIEQPVLSCVVSEHATRGQFIAHVAASDADIVDTNKLNYAIVGGNDQQTFSINSTNGIITLVNMQKFGSSQMTVLNVSVSDGVYTAFSRVKIGLSPANKYAPRFQHVIQEAIAMENQLPDMLVTTVKATDEDFGDYGVVTYSIPSKLLQETFSINSQSGELTTLVKLDRERTKEYEVPIMASDGGGRLAFTTVRVKVGDENDNAPVFLLKEYKAAIHSNITIGGSFLRLKAVDADDGMNSKIEYSIYETKNSGINDIFSMNPNTGTLSLLDIATTWESQVFQFWVRATDKGNKPLHTDVPVEVYIMAFSDKAPVFERNHDKFFLPENSPRGTVITRLKLVSDVKSQFRILPGLFDPSLFSVDGEGQLILSGPLNREDKDSHLIGIVAETLGSPPLTSMAEVTLNILDENDHAPVFHSSPYVIALAENVEPGTSVLKVIAVDRDSGTNGEIRYALSPDSEKAADIFSIDPYTGWITTLVALDRETKPEHKFQVLAMDNAHMKQITRTAVVIRLRDYNDCPPVFKQSHYKAAINEDALPGTIIIKLETTDEDYDETPTDYYIVSGDPHCQFQIRQTGEVYVTKQLDRETIPFYNLEIIVSDGRHTARTRLSIVVLDTNDNPPYCLRHRYRHTTSENLSIGSYLLTVLASDADEPQNAKLRYYLSGDHSDHFSIDKESGELKTAISLDRERQWKYQLMAHVQDREKTEWECSSEIEIVVSDVNDNAPQFSMNQYSVTLPEDVEVGTLVTKVHATDNDIGINRKIRYGLIDDLGGQFKMTPDSGIVTLGIPLDRETKSTYTLEVKATDQGNPSHWTQATILLTVSDINDNPPEFANKYYFAIVPEIDAIGTEVVRVLATSKDTGVNADVYYSIIGGNEHEKFTIDSISGVISIAQMLDYERAKEYFLTIQAIDGGIPPLSNLATVNITVTDSNDNAPIFTQSTYNARIREDAQIGDKILQVIANDYDSESNGKVTYSIERGDRSGQFVIDTDTGYISVAALLDRETQSSYVLEVHARDHGLPVLTNFVLVNVDISDANDNPPLFSQSNYTAVVQEDKPLGFMILKFVVHDADDHPNAAPYTFDFQSGNEVGAFRLEQDGFLRTAAKFNHKIKDHYTLQVRVFDNGTPPLYSDTWIIIKVIEESQYPPVITPLEVSINSFLDEYPGGEIGKVYASDQDTYDTLTYSLAPTNGIPYPAANLFRIDQYDGTLVALPRLDIGDYRVNVTVSDGKFLSSTIVKVSVELISEEMLANAVIVRFREVNEKDFVVSHRKGFVRAVRNAMNSRLKDVIIVSVQPSSDDINFLPGKEKRYLDELQYTNSTDYTRSRYTRQIIAHDLDVLFAVRKSSNQGNVVYHTSESIRKSLNANLEELEESTKLVVEEIVRVKCGAHFCAFGECQEKITLDGSKMIPIAADFTSLVCPVHQYKTECRCHDGYGGDKCETIINACARKPCPDHMKCFPDQSSQGYNCQCVDSFKCDVDSTRCYGENCFRPVDSVSFGGKSYAQYRVEKGLINGKKMLEDQLTLSLRFRTMYLSGTLMYAAGRIDYNILEVVNGVVQYRLELGTGECVIQVTSVRVSDNRWHEVRLERNGNSARITVDGKHIVHGSAPGTNQILNLYSDNLFIGAQVRQHPAILGLEDVQRGFVGCMGGVHIAMEPLPLRPGGGDATKAAGTAALIRLANVEMGCPTHLAVPGACSSLPCLNGGTCKDIPSLLESSDNNSDYECQCHERFSGRHCELDTDPCASQPCLYGGVCTATSDGDYTCTCPDGLRGRRCEVGRWCGAGGSGGGLNSNGICAHGGVCEEGDWEPSCRCHGYYGSLCQFDIDECQGEPCLNGATCINEPGSFRCVCPPDKTGMNCGNPLYSDAVTAGVYSLLGWKWEHLAALGGGLVLLLLLAVSCVTLLLVRCKRKARRPRPQSPQKDNLLNSVAKPHEMQVLKRGSKLSNLEVQRSGIGGVERPVSYAPVSTVHDSHHATNNMVINNLDTLRSYGSAGDELENFPPDYRRNLNLDVLQNNTNNVGDNDSLHKPSWSEQMHLQTFQDHKINNDLKGSCNTAKPPPPSDVVISPQRGTLAGRLVQDPRILGGYHWDCSDWCNTGMGTGALPNITEVPGSEVPDSSSLHSDESNTSRRHRPSAMVSPPPLPQIQGVEEESPYAGDEDEGEITDDVYQFNNANSYLLHPNTYLPHYTASSEGETGAPDDPEPYGFPPRRRSYRDDDIGSVITMLEERNSLLGAGSTSDLSTNLCEIEESDCENEPGKLGKHWTNGVQHTDV